MKTEQQGFSEIFGISPFLNRGIYLIPGGIRTQILLDSDLLLMVSYPLRHQDPCGENILALYTIVLLSIFAVHNVDMDTWRPATR